MHLYTWVSYAGTHLIYLVHTDTRMNGFLFVCFNSLCVTRQICDSKNTVCKRMNGRRFVCLFSLFHRLSCVIDILALKRVQMNRSSWTGAWKYSNFHSSICMWIRWRYRILTGGDTNVDAAQSHFQAVNIERSNDTMLLTVAVFGFQYSLYPHQQRTAFYTNDAKMAALLPFGIFALTWFEQNMNPINSERLS